MLISLDEACTATAWTPFNSVFDLCISLLCPQAVGVACTVGKFLSEYLAAREILFCNSPFSTAPRTLSSSKWLGGRSDKFNELVLRIKKDIIRRSDSSSPLPTPSCVYTNMWVIWHSYQPLVDAFQRFVAGCMGIGKVL